MERICGAAGACRQHDLLHRRVGTGGVCQPVSAVGSVHGRRGGSVRDIDDGRRPHLRRVPSQVSRESAHCAPHADADGRTRGSRRHRVQRRCSYLLTYSLI